jgi:hypothetical protein
LCQEISSGDADSSKKAFAYCNAVGNGDPGSDSGIRRTSKPDADAVNDSVANTHDNSTITDKEWNDLEQNY